MSRTMLTSSPARHFGRRALESPASKPRRSVSVRQQPQRATRATIPAPTLTAETIATAATPSVALAWSWRSKFWSYFKGVMAAMVALAVMTAALDGREPSSTTALRINTYFPIMYLSFIMAPVLVPVIIGLAKCAEYFELPRGTSDMSYQTA